jgi:hypothetical protein
MRLIKHIAALVLALLFCDAAHAQTQPAALHWQPWSDAAFAQANAEHKFVLLDLEAVWCHWCHVMDDITYRDPIVVRLLNERYVLVKVDQDSRPDIANRYQDYGWPATIVFAADGSEIVKRQGYIPPRPMSSMLQAIIDDPSPGPSIEKQAAFEPATEAAIHGPLLARIQAQYEKQYDQAEAGWGFSHKYLDSDSVEYALRLGAAGNAEAAERAADTLHAATALIDSVWGGMYQYSVGGHCRILKSSSGFNRWRCGSIRSPTRPIRIQRTAPRRNRCIGMLLRFSPRRRAPSMFRRMRTCMTAKRTRATSGSATKRGGRWGFRASTSISMRARTDG